jgi:hypothetical protein
MNLLLFTDSLLRLAANPQREAMITERQNKRELAKEAWMLNHQKRKNQNAGSASKSKASAAESSSNQDKAADDDMSSNARA